jgi:hypothetical protein
MTALNLVQASELLLNITHITVLPKWKPKPLSRTELSKRKAKQQAAPWADGGQYPQATARELDAIIDEMELDEPPQEVKTRLLLALNSHIFNVADGMRRLQETLEKKELLKGLQGNLRRVLNSLGLDDHSTAEIYNSNSFSDAMNPTQRHGRQPHR